MKKILLSALSLFSLAGAQTTPPTLRITAPVGTTVELRSVTTSRLTVSDIQVAAKPGGKATPAQVEEARKSMQDGLTTMNKAGTTVNGKAFFKVTSRDAAGNTTLVNSIVQTLPAAAGKQAENMTIRITQVISPTGQVGGLKLESDQPQVNAMFRNLTPEKLQQMSKDMSGNDAGLYAHPLKTGEPVTTTASMDMQDLMSNIIGALAGPDSAQLFGNVKATPLTMTTTTTYQGLNTAGQHAFTTTSNASNWKINVTSQDRKIPLSISAEILNSQSQGTSIYTSNGLPAARNLKSNISMKMTMEMDDIQVTMTMTIDQTNTLQR